MSEHDDFTPRATVTGGLPPVTEVELTEDDGVLKVLLVQDASGWPEVRPPAWRPAAAGLRPGQTLRWQVNYRFTAEQSWYYRLDTLNVCCGTGQAGVFLDPPTYRIDERSRLR